MDVHDICSDSCDTKHWIPSRMRDVIGHAGNGMLAKELPWHENTHATRLLSFCICFQDSLLENNSIELQVIRLVGQPKLAQIFFFLSVHAVVHVQHQNPNGH